MIIAVVIPIIVMVMIAMVDMVIVTMKMLVGADAAALFKIRGGRICTAARPWSSRGCGRVNMSID
jgi:hypothetical protein